MNQTEIWFFECSNYYKELYLEMCRQLIRRYYSQGDYKNLVQLYEKIISIYPFDGWQTELVRYYLECGKQKEAQQIYTATMELYTNEMEIPPEKEMQRCFEQFNPRPAKETILRLLAEDVQPGACYCSYTSFTDYCRIAQRMQCRQLTGGILMFLTLGQNGKKECTGNDNQAGQMKLLKEAIRLSLRRSDVYTRHGDDGYILMLVQVTESDSCAKIFRRIEDCYHRIEKGQGELWYQVAEIGKI